MATRTRYLSTQLAEWRQRVALTTGGAIGLSTFASAVGLCCIGPWSVTLFGVSGAVALARWQPYRFYIAALAATLLGWAFWRVYRRQPACGDETCPPNPSRRLKVTLWAAAVLVVLAFFAEELQWMLVAPTLEV